MRPLEQIFMVGPGTEVFYSFIIIVCSLMVYFGTKELYELSSYKGIKYFRLSFLFFALAYFFRSFITFILSFFNIGTIHEFSPIFMPIGPLTLLLFMYFSSMALFYLLYSIIWKKWDKNSIMVYTFHIIAVIISLVSIFSRRMEVLLGINIFLFIFVSSVFYVAHKDKKIKNKWNNLYAVYILLLIFWVLNIIDILIPPFLQTFQMVIYLASCGIFLIILYKVLKKTGN
ncbi:MAG: hypothetical protein PHD81_04730 [Candidatus Nanoarchaeia archaeon]|nr:hypothetical protein [Candidatus Nanoarchaeia archaeon]MDD5588382.1 hypothetical protein [Candidatus Nanoarchaeia archaeon]